MTQSLEPRHQPKQNPRGNSAVALLMVLFNLLLLTVGSGIAWMVGMAIAQVYPSSSLELPVLEKFLRRSQTSKMGQSTQALRTSTPTLSPSIPSIRPSVLLTAEKRQDLQTQLQQVQQDLNTLIGRTAALETQLGMSRPDHPLEERLQSIEQQVEAPGNVSPGVASRNSSFPVNPDPSRGLIVTLPSDILFASGSNTLRSGANVILDNLIADLEAYPQAAIRVAGHTDRSGQPNDNLSLSLQQAEAVVQYLSQTVGEGYHWVAIGHGSSRPAVEPKTVEPQSDANQQLNRRIEVAIHPKSS
ncbi:MAG: OmpA family protein [Microcoleaceae cyanobacterium]